MSGPCGALTRPSPAESYHPTAACRAVRPAAQKAGRTPRAQRPIVPHVRPKTTPGTLPPEWARQPRLIEINVSGNALEGELPAAWAALVALRRLDASGNGGLNGTLPASWGQLPALQEL